MSTLITTVAGNHGKAPMADPVGPQRRTYY